LPKREKRETDIKRGGEREKERERERHGRLAGIKISNISNTELQLADFNTCTRERKQNPKREIGTTRSRV